MAALVAVSGCSADPPRPTGAPSPTPPLPTASASPSADPGLAWQDCALGECATLTVPLDHDEPEGRRLGLRVARVAATRSPVLGVLVVNPGGPGASGATFAAALPRRGLEQFDVVGWDPRGVSGPDAVACPTGADADAYLALDGSPDSAEEEAALVEGNIRFAEGCREASGELLDHLSVTDTARDLELLRVALGQERLTYYGASYGTAIGAAHAALFPDSVGRFVLDAGVEPRRPPTTPQAVAFDEALAAFGAWCTDCALAGPDPAARVSGLLDRLDAAPLPVGDRRLTQTLAASGLTALFGGGQDAWPALADAVADAEGGDGRALLDASDTHAGLLASFTASYCADDDVRTPQLAAERWRAERAVAPVFGEALGSPWLCVGWTAEPAAPPDLPATGIPPALVLGGPGDPVTPFAWSQELAAALPGSVLVRTPGRGHVAFGRGSACVDILVLSYLTEGDLPPAGASCA